MQTPPEIGRIYQSKEDPSILILVTDFMPSGIDPEDNTETGYYVEGCHPDDKNNMQAVGYDFTQDEWEGHRFAPLN